jgi:hypothetical protein
MADTKRPPRPSPPIMLTRDNAIANLKMMMPPPGYSEGGGGNNRNLPGGNIGGSGNYQQPWASDANNVARPPAPPPLMNPNPPTAVPPRDIPNVANTFRSPQNTSGYGEAGTKVDPSTNPGAFLSGDQYRAIPPSVPAPVRAYMGNNPATDMAKGGIVGKPKWRKYGW